MVAVSTVVETAAEAVLIAVILEIVCAWEPLVVRSLDGKTEAVFEPEHAGRLPIHRNTHTVTRQPLMVRLVMRMSLS